MRSVSIYNEERPYEALGQRLPVEVYTPCTFPDRLEDPWYDADHQVRRVRRSGEIMWKGELVFIDEALVGEFVGIAELETGDYVARFCDLDIGVIDRCGRFGRFAPARPGPRPAKPPANQNLSGLNAGSKCRP